MRFFSCWIAVKYRIHSHLKEKSQKKSQKKIECEYIYLAFEKCILSRLLSHQCIPSVFGVSIETTEKKKRINLVFHNNNPFMWVGLQQKWNSKYVILKIGPSIKWLFCGRFLSFYSETNLKGLCRITANIQCFPSILLKKKLYRWK